MGPGGGMVIALDLTPTYALDGWTGNATDGDGVDWIITAELGWSSGPPVRLTAADRAGADGAVSGPVLRGARLITLTGTAVAPSRHRMLLAKDRLNAVAAGAGPYWLTVAEEHLTRAVLVKQFAETKIADAASYVFSFELSLRADDPLRYAADALTAAATLTAPATGGLRFPLRFPLAFTGSTPASLVTVDNPGTAPTAPVLRMTGPVSSPVVLNLTTGEYTAVAVDLGASDVLVVDNGARTVSVNGAPRRSALRAGSSWWAISPGVVQIAYSAAATTASELTVTYRPAWK